MAYLTYYQPHPADLGRRSTDVAHAVDSTDPNRSVAGELLHRSRLRGVGLAAGPRATHAPQPWGLPVGP
jgi:hypothetical protein